MSSKSEMASNTKTTETPNSHRIFPAIARFMLPSQLLGLGLESEEEKVDCGDEVCLNILVQGQRQHMAEIMRSAIFFPMPLS